MTLTTITSQDGELQYAIYDDIDPQLAKLLQRKGFEVGTVDIYGGSAVDLAVELVGPYLLAEAGLL